MNPSFTFLAVNLPGMPNVVLGALIATFAGISFILDFIPPTPQSIANLQVPSITLFLDAALGAVKLPDVYPPFELELGGVTISIPGVGVGPPPFDVSGLFKLIASVVAAPFLLIKDMVTGLLNLQIALPTLDGVIDLLAGLFSAAGIATEAVVHLASCLGQAIFGLFSSLIPV
jgi:hypothetical protein